MPTTRFASSTGNTDSTALNGNITAESIQEQRQKSFNGRKKREVPSDLSPKQKIMIQFINHITDVDKKHLLWSKAADESIGIDTVIERVYKLKYKDFASLKADLDKVFSACIHIIKKSIPELDAFKKLYTYTNHSLALEASRLEEELEENEHVVEFISLFRPTNDGYAFTDMIARDPAATPITNYPHNIHELIVHKAQAAALDEVPLLKDVVAPPPTYYSKIVRHEDKPIVPINWLDFGAFSSFAPASDSNNANATYENTYMGRSAKRFKKWEQKQLEKEDETEEPAAEEMDTNDEELNALWLEKEGFDVKAIEEAVNNNNNNNTPDNIAQELERNCQLLEQLVQYQHSRFSAGKTKWDAVEEKEVEIAKTLEKHMMAMLSKLPPNATTDTDIIESTMTRLPLLDSSYRGTLPPHKIFSFPTTERAENLPPYANITPTYSKDNWRLVRVAPVPPKDMTGNLPVFPLVSMMEQQQLNFYQRAPFPGQPQQQPLPLQQQPQTQQRVPVAAAGSSFAYQQQPQRR
ncbi:uncharacterized protein ATC70_005469 [Mucor velutinosus]|uniref:Uncharacterized protein n=1 Tax=Mucor velutinosus TaxID=708070 RepID=A0AAN7D9X0_9FUNG|nr:hypothetical protein ATC70_005469 [Mucor velutinosus]